MTMKLQDLYRIDYSDVGSTLWNVFCATGEGGGQDNSCGKEGGGTTGKKDKGDKLFSKVEGMEGKALSTSAGAVHGPSSAIITALEGEKLAGKIQPHDVATVLDDVKAIGMSTGGNGRGVLSISKKDVVKAVLKAAKTGKHNGNPVTSYLQLLDVAESIK